MIAHLSGTVLLRDDPTILIDVSGVGYKVYATQAVLAKTVAGETLSIFTYTHVKEDSLELFGFLEYQDLKLFEYLLSVSGIGPKTAIGIFSVGARSQIIEAIRKGDTVFFTAVPRLGKKNAQKIIIELKTKLGSSEEFDLSEGFEGQGDIVEALRIFGFSTQEAVEGARAVEEKGKTTEEKIKLALKHLGK